MDNKLGRVIIEKPFKFYETSLSGSFVIEPALLEDDRGWFFRSFSEESFSVLNLNTQWPQMNHSFSAKIGTIRGLHFQHPPFAEVKLVRCIAGSVFDVIVDIRANSKTFLQSFAIILSSSNKKMLYIPKGFAHGFQVLESNSELLYMHSQPYTAMSEGGLLYSDKMLAIDWPLPVSQLSSRDSNHPIINNEFSGIKI